MVYASGGDLAIRGSGAGADSGSEVWIQGFWFQILVLRSGSRDSGSKSWFQGLYPGVLVKSGCRLFVDFLVSTFGGFW